MTAIDFRNIRSNAKGQRDCFEALAVQLFRSTYNPPSGSTFFSLRGDGGDGGVEAYYSTPTGVVGVQAKYFFALGNNELNQIKSSLATALSNHPTLREYIVYIPFDLTGRVAQGKRGQSEVERFETWKLAEEKNSAAADTNLTITLCTAADIVRQLSTVDKHGGMRRYWFDAETLTSPYIRKLLAEAEKYAGPRFMAALDIATSAHRGLDFFGGTGDYAGWYSETISPQLDYFAGEYEIHEQVLNVLPYDEAETAKDLIEQIVGNLKLLKDDVTSDIGEVISHSINTLLPLLKKVQGEQEALFNEKHGADKDTLTFRHFFAEFMVSFPAGDMDSARSFVDIVGQIQDDLASVECRAGSIHSLLLQGPAGIGKTHAIVSAALRRFELGGMSIIAFGEDFETGEPWEVLRSKVGFGANMGRDELYECFQACADNSGLPFVIYIDALNEIINKRRWRTNLPQLLEQLKPYPGIKLCVSARDIYLEKVIDKTFPGIAFNHFGFAGHEYEALEGFAAFYSLDKEITPLFSKELSNPLFLHLACKALVAENRRTLDMSLPGFKSLIDSHLKECDRKIRDRIDYVNKKNLTRAAMLTLSKTLTDALPRNRTWDACLNAVKNLVGNELTPEILLHQLELENLIILSTDENEETIVRLGYQRYGDTMQAIQLVDDCSSESGLDYEKLSTRLKGFVSDDEGVLDAVAVVLPEMQKVEITHERIKLPKNVAYGCYIRSLIWRSKDSFSADTDGRIREAFSHTGWLSIYEALFSICLVPGHRLNAENGLSNFLAIQKMVDRDVYLNAAAYLSYDAFGAIRSLLNSALKADLSRWPKESHSLALCALGWLTSSSDRRVRDLAAKGITRILVHSPVLAETAVSYFSDIDDDYVKEAVSLAVYSACLLSDRASLEHMLALKAMLKYRWIDSPNVLIRETIELLSEVLTRDNLIPSSAIATARTVHSLPNPWPTQVEAQPLLSIDKIPSNMRLIGRGLSPDFMRYQVESTISEFDIEKSGITYENIGAWIITETLQMGYPGRGQMALSADQRIMSESGGGRAKHAYKERLGKKYYWISLHRLVGILADNVPPATSYSGASKPQNRLWSLDSRKVDLTDFRDLTIGREYPDRILRGPRYPFPAQAVTMKTWVTAIDFTPHEDCLIRRAEDDVEWVPLWLSARDNNREPNDWTNPYLNVDVFYRSIFIDMKIPPKELANMLYVADRTCSPNRGYFAEYPNGKAYAQLAAEGYMDWKRKGLSLGRVTLMRGTEWEYDFSWQEGAQNLDAPNPDIIKKMGLKWDRQRGWTNANGVLCAFHSHMGKREGLFIERTVLNQYLALSNQTLMFYSFIQKGLNEQSADSEQIDVSAFILYHERKPPVVTKEDKRPYNC